MEEREPSYNVGRNVNCCGHCGESMEVSQKTSELPYGPVIPFLSIYLKKTQTTNAKSCMHPSVYKQQCLKLQRHGSNPSVNQQRNGKRRWGVQWNTTQPKKEQNSAIGSNMDELGGHYVSEISQIEKDKYCMISFIHGI